jgi:eukaryotic-like serine/threonine-protein kinase
VPAPSTVERVLARMRESGDFPAMANTVGQISELTSSEATSTSVLAETVLQDYGLAQKLLRLVNTAAFAQRGQVTTISRAVLLLGFERVRSVATGLILFEHLQAQAKTADLVDTLNMSFYSAILGRTIADGTSFADPEEAFISALFHNLGRMLVALYLPDELALIKASEEQDRDAAVQSVLGQSYTALGIAIAESLNLPAKLSDSMTRIAGSRSHQSMTDAEKLACLATLANGITDALAAPTDAKDKRSAIDRLVRSYGAHFAALDGKIDSLIGGAVLELKEHSKTFNLDLPGSAFVHGLGEWRIESLVSTGGKDGIAAASAAGGLIDIAEPDLAADEVPETVLTRGLHEITSLLVTEFTLDDVLRVILETIYRALGVGRTRAFFLLKDPAAAIARFRFGLGQSAADMRAWIEVPLSGVDDLFSLSMRQHKDVVIKNISAPEVNALLPEWYPQRIAGGRFVVLLPLVVDQKALGLFYVDGEASGARLLTPALVNYLKVLRGQAVVAIRQKSARPDTRRK